MKNKKRVALTLMALALLTALTATIIGCAGSATKVVVASGYKKHFAIDATLAVTVLDNAPQWNYRSFQRSEKNPPPDDTTDAKIPVSRYLNERLLKHLLNEVDVKDAFMAIADRDYLVTKEEVSTSDEDITVEIPDVGTKIKFDGKEASLVLFLDKIRIGTETDNPWLFERDENFGVNTNIPRSLVLLASFVIWDNRELKPISYGRVKTVAHLGGHEAADGDWDDITRDFVRKIFESTGFIKRDDMGKM